MPHLDDVLRAPESTYTQTYPKNDGHTVRRGSAGKQALGILAILVLACLGLTACGGSSPGSSSNAAATGSAATSSTGTSSTTGGSSTQSTTPGTARARFGATRECLQKNGVTLPKRTPGSGPPAGGGGFLGSGGAPALPKGMTRAQFEAALKKCGGGNFGARYGRPGGPGVRRIDSPVFKTALTKYAACLRQNGINIAAPNTSGKGPIFSTKGIDTSSSQFKAATLKCRAGLLGAFRRPQRTGTQGTTTAPHSGTTGGEGSG